MKLKNLVDKDGFLFDNIYVKQIFLKDMFLMRVIAGDKKGRRLVTPSGLETRPTSDKVKEALFSIIQFDLDGALFLDLFSGSGQIGIEALSRGAQKAVFVDMGRQACDCIKKNVIAVEYLRHAEIINANAEDYLSRCPHKFDIVFMDPPYMQGLVEKVFEKTTSVCKDSAIIICEVSAGQKLFEECNGFCLGRRYRYGKTELAVYRKQDSQLEIY